VKGQLIGQGRTAEIFAWGDGQILKLLRDGFPDQVIEYEARIARIISATGLEAPAVGELVEVENRKGLIYQRVEGPSMLQILSAKPWQLFKLAGQFAALHAEMHQRQGPDLPGQKAQMTRAIQNAPVLPETTKQRLFTILDQMPDETAVCHGDYHPGNILMSPAGPIIIDWSNAVGGDPLADVARTSLILRSPILPPGINPFEQVLLSAFRRLFDYAYLRTYVRIRPYQSARLKAWIPLVAAARLNEKISEEENYLMGLIEKGLNK
jgi:uncharacterized protein (TIGR02172 family)